jgi:hypothetical protein
MSVSADAKVGNMAPVSESADLAIKQNFLSKKILVDLHA